MENIIKENVIDVVEDVKRQCVEIQCNSNAAGEKLVTYLRNSLQDGVIREIRYLFGTRDFEVETYTKEQTRELYRVINGILENKASVSHAFLDTVLNIGGDIAKTAISGKQNASVQKEQAKYAAQASVAQAQADAQASIEKANLASSNKMLYIGIGVGILVVGICILFIFRKK